MADNLVVKATIKAKDLLSAPVVRMAGTIRSRLGPALDHARTMARRVKVQFSESWDRLKSMSIAAGVVAGAASLVVKRFIDAGDELGEFSARVGVGVEALQELRFAAERSGVSVEEFDQSLSTLNKGLGQMKAGTGKLNAFLGKVSPTLQKQMRGARNTGEAFDIMVAALAKVSDPARRAALASAAFGSAGGKMALMAQNGAEGLAKLREEARKYGIISQEEADAAGAADDAMINLKHSMVGVGNVIGSKVIPILIPLIQRLTEWIVQNRELIATKVQQFIEGFAETLKNVDWKGWLDDIRSVIQTIRSIIETLGGWNVAIISVLTYLGLLGPTLKLGFSALTTGVPYIIKYIKWFTAVQLKRE